MSYLGSGTQPVAFSDTAQLDSFGRLRVSEPNILLDSQMLSDIQPLLWDTATTGGGTVVHDAPNASAVLTVPAAVSSVIRQTYRYWNYRAGQSFLATLTSVFGAAVPGVERELGFGDTSNGIFFRQTTAGGLELQVRSTSASGTQTVPQANWNVDPLDGTGPSGVTLDITKIQIFFLDIQWLGAGRVRCGFTIGGQKIIVHEFLHANLISSVYTTSAVLPIRYAINNTTGASAATLNQVCSSVVWEGGTEPPSYEASVDNGVTSFLATTTLTSLLAVRLRASHIRASIAALDFSVANLGSKNIRAVLLHFTAANAPAGLIFGDASGNASQFSTTHVAVTEANGYRLQSSYVLNASSAKSGTQTTAVDSYLRVAANIAGQSDVLVLAVQTLDTTSACVGTIAYREFY
jgi:hypothetical protein